MENFSTKTGQHTNAVFGFTSMLINLLRDEQPTHLAVCFDVSRKTFRSERYAEYKANRSAMPEPLVQQRADQGLGLGEEELPEDECRRRHAQLGHFRISRLRWAAPASTPAKAGAPADETPQH